MATLRLVNNTAAPLPIVDCGIVLAASATVDFTDSENTRNLIMSQDLRTLVTAGSLSLQDGIGTPIVVLDLYSYWARCGYNTDKNAPMTELYLKSPNGQKWKITISNLGVLSTASY